MCDIRLTGRWVSGAGVGRHRNGLRAGSRTRRRLSSALCFKCRRFGRGVDADGLILGPGYALAVSVYVFAKQEASVWIRFNGSALYLLLLDFGLDNL
jgi:hypothetical protein